MFRFVVVKFFVVDLQLKRRVFKQLGLFIMDAANIRIDASLLLANQGKLVRIIGKCESYDGSSNTATLNSNGTIPLSLQNDSLVVGKNYEIIGKCSSNNLGVNVYSVIELSDNINLDVAQKLVSYVHKVPELFYS
jgi:replication factor A3